MPNLSGSRRRPLLSRAAPFLGAMLLSVGCSSSTAPRSPDVALRAAIWSQRRPTDYAYDYQLGSGFFIEFAGRWVHVVVRGNAVVSATDVETGEAMRESLTTWPTIDQLFEDAQEAAQSGSLLGIRYDPQYGYPTEIDLAGPPDASGSLYARNLAPQ